MYPEKPHMLPQKVTLRLIVYDVDEENETRSIKMLNKMFIWVTHL